MEKFALHMFGGLARMKKSTIVFSAANLVGMVLCWLFVASICQTTRMEQRDYYDFGDSTFFILTALPAFLLCCLLNAIWGVMALVAISRRRDYHSAIACGIVVAVWAAAILLVRQIT